MDTMAAAYLRRFEREITRLGNGSIITGSVSSSLFSQEPIASCTGRLFQTDLCDTDCCSLHAQNLCWVCEKNIFILADHNREAVDAVDCCVETQNLHLARTKTIIYIL